ncbi:hypothetical protein CPB86DRAFT_778347 [Serendipita vermifera]|nr:hypothetical protein CPB86DRAFT_778347 [Serendipita vermifera]
MEDEFVPDSEGEQSLLLSRTSSPLSTSHDASFGEELENENEEPANKTYTLSSISQFTSTVEGSLKPTFESPINQFSTTTTNSTVKKPRQGNKDSQKWAETITIDLSDDEVVPTEKFYKPSGRPFTLDIPKHPAVIGWKEHNEAKSRKETKPKEKRPKRPKSDESDFEIQEISETEVKPRRKDKARRGALDDTPINISSPVQLVPEETKVKGGKKKGNKEKENSPEPFQGPLDDDEMPPPKKSRKRKSPEADIAESVKRKKRRTSGPSVDEDFTVATNHADQEENIVPDILDEEITAKRSTKKSKASKERPKKQKQIILDSEVDDDSAPDELLLASEPEEIVEEPKVAVGRKRGRKKSPSPVREPTPPTEGELASSPEKPKSTKRKKGRKKSPSPVREPTPPSEEEEPASPPEKPKTKRKKGRKKSPSPLKEPTPPAKDEDEEEEQPASPLAHAEPEIPPPQPKVESKPEPPSKPPARLSLDLKGPQHHIPKRGSISQLLHKTGLHAPLASGKLTRPTASRIAPLHLMRKTPPPSPPRIPKPKPKKKNDEESEEEDFTGMTEKQIAKYLEEKKKKAWYSP